VPFLVQRSRSGPFTHERLAFRQPARAELVARLALFADSTGAARSWSNVARVAGACLDSGQRRPPSVQDTVTLPQVRLPPAYQQAIPSPQLLADGSDGPRGAAFWPRDGQIVRGMAIPLPRGIGRCYSGPTPGPDPILEPLSRPGGGLIFSPAAAPQIDPEKPD
jgi:hypothetical protein